MKLITELLEKRFAEIGKQGKDNPLVIDNASGQQTWHITMYDPRSGTCLGYLVGEEEKKWGYFPLDKLEILSQSFLLSIEKDCFFEEIHFDNLMQLPRYIIIQDMSVKKNNKDRDCEQQR
ncbi:MULTISPECIES: DUF2958 domain-containing protein [unclassified Chryseobacterium]|uniref:DUF2958 domain-containing protein n=1 Tax=unclassified Chryseobacterium TaxID=2593645 RepID=UPI000D37931C|nr:MULTISPECIES: DUF2958 domain-containing protein [unclassified Chryseobacterium]PTT76538.1 hypothetical protein DBR25_05495 [Chryseobacterium sp. HMWF001]PVV55577.1 hypothetical protein DD829_13990 [Chryseobacterium sp. HMWF035]